MRTAAALLLCELLMSGCGLPRDASDTLGRVRNRVLRAGAAENRPWAVDRGDRFEGIEGELVTAIAGSVGARIEWVRMPEFELIAALRRRELDLAIGGFHQQLPWAQQIAFTRPYFSGGDGKARVLAVPPGENAWLLHVDREIERHKPELKRDIVQGGS